MIEAEIAHGLLLIGCRGAEVVELVIVDHYSLVFKCFIKGSSDTLTGLFVGREISHGLFQSFSITVYDSLADSASSEIFYGCELRELSHIFVDVGRLADIRASTVCGLIGGFVCCTVRWLGGVTWCQIFCWFF